MLLRMDMDSESKNTPRKTYACHICYRTFNRLHRLQSHLVSHKKQNNSILSTIESANGDEESQKAATNNIRHDSANSLTQDVDQNDAIGEVESEVVVETEKSGDKKSKKKKKDRPKDNLKVTYDCEMCPMKLPSKCSLVKHQLSHTIEKPYVCPSCGKAFAQVGHLGAHSRVHEPNHNSLKYPKGNPEKPPKKRGNQIFECSECGKTFKNKCYLDRHFLSHSNEKPFKCQICDKGFTQIGNLNVHYKIHSNEKNCVCYICDKAFAHISSLKVHMVTHSEQKPHKCEVCNKGFANPCFLKRHMLIHKKLKPFVCDICGKGFAQSGNLNVHMHIHSKPKLFQCDVCKTTFIAKGSYEKHCIKHVMDNLLKNVVTRVDFPGTEITLPQQKNTWKTLVNRIKQTRSKSVANKTKEIKQNNSTILVKSPFIKSTARKSIQIKSCYSTH